MTAYRPCHNCVLEKTACAKREGIRAGVKGLGLTSINFRCDQRQPLFAVGQRVTVTWIVPMEDGEWDEACAESWPATVVAERRPKFQILVDDVPSDYDTPARSYIKNETLYAKVTAAKLKPLDEPARAVCGVCQGVQVGSNVPGCFGYDAEAGGGYGYTPQRCLKAALPFCDSGRHPEGENSRSEVEGEACQSGAEGNRQTSISSPFNRAQGWGR